MAAPFYLEAPKGDEYKPSLGERLGRAWDNTPAEAFFSLAEAMARPGGPFASKLAMGLTGFGRQVDAANKRKGLASAFDSILPTIPESQRPMFAEMVKNDPQALMQAYAGQMFSKPAESWKPVDIDGDGKNDFQQSSITGEFKDMPKTLGEEERLRRAGASSTVINNLPAEMGARIGLGEGFLKNFDDIKSRASKFFGSKSVVEQAKARGQMIFNTGEGGKLWRDVEVGKEALVRLNTGAGMPAQEAEDQASKYSIGPYDTEFDAITKLESLRNAIVNTASGAYKARGATYVAPSGGGTGELTFNPATGRLE